MPMSAFRCALVDVALKRLKKTLERVLNNTILSKYGMSKEVIEGIRERIRELEKFVENKCSGIDEERLGEILFDIRLGVKILSAIVYENDKLELLEILGMAREYLSIIERTIAKEYGILAH